MALQRYEGTTVDEFGNVIPGASIEVKREDNLAALALLYSNRAGTTTQANGLAFVSDSEGAFAFHALGGAYRIRIYKTIDGVLWEKIKRYVAIGTAQETDLDQGLSGGMLLTFDSGTTDADPGTGALRFNHATPASVTFLYVDLANTYGDDITAWLASLDDAGGVNDKGRIRVQVDGNPAVWFDFKITGDVVTATGYRKIPVVLIASAGTLADADALALFFSAAGPGAAADISYAGGTGMSATNVEAALDELANEKVSGPASVTDDLPAIFDGTTGKLIKSKTYAAFTALLDAFTSSLKGLVPASGGGTTNFLRADGAWAAPPGGGGGSGDVVGPASATNGGFAKFDTTTGKLLKDSTAIVAIADGGTGASLTDPNADRIMFWDDSAGAMAFLTPGTNLSITGTTLDAAGGSGQPVPTTATYAVGTMASMFISSTTAVANGATVAGSLLESFIITSSIGGTSATVYASGAAQTGTWMNVSGTSLAGAATIERVGNFVRTI